MIVKWFKYGSGDSTAAFNYLLNDRVEKGTARVLRGSPHITKSIVKSLKTKKKYKSGCLSFEEKDISAKHKEEIMNLFEQTIFPGIPPQNRTICFVEHTDKGGGRIELNYVIPRVELQTNKAFQPYFDRVDRKRFELFRDYINEKYGFSNPNDPSKKQSINLGDLVKYKKVDHIKELDKYLQTQVSKGRLQNQSDVVTELIEVGYTISRVGKDYISIKTDTMKPIRLRGRIYSKDWTIKEEEKQSTKELFTQLQIEINKAKLYNENKYYGGLSLANKEVSKKNDSVATLSQKKTL